MSSSRQELPCLAFHRRGHSTALYTVPEEENLVVALNAGDKEEVLRNKTICPTARGLLLARDPNTMATFLWRPEDGDQLIHLPPLEGLDDGVLMHSHCVLSDEPSAPGCVVLLVEGCDDTYMWYCHPGDDAWVKHEYDVGTITLPCEYQGSKHLKIPICPIAACRGKFYFNSGPEDLGVLEFCPDPVFTSIAIDNSYESEDDEEDEEYSGGPNPGASVFLVESGDELYRVKLLYATLSHDEIDEGFVQKMDFSARRWRDVGDLCGRTFLLSSFYFGASCYGGGGESGLRQDCVYFVNTYRKEMQVFNVKEDTNEVHRLDEAPPADKAFWLLPSTSP